MAHAIGESRGELLGWLNDLLQLSYTKVEQCGSGAVYCQIIDSIYQDLPMSKVKFNAKSEFEYINNFKILTQAFKKHKIDKPIQVELLIKCKALDNLEFLQWLKKFWDVHFPGGDYDAASRRSAAGGVSSTTTAARPASAARTQPASARAAAPIKRTAASTAAPRALSRTGNTNTATDAAVQALTTQMGELRTSVEGLEKERDFYFAKLRDIEILVGARLEGADESVSGAEEDLLKQIQAILYSTEEGFEIPDEEDLAAGEEETF